MFFLFIVLHCPDLSAFVHLYSRPFTDIFQSVLECSVVSSTIALFHVVNGEKGHKNMSYIVAYKVSCTPVF
jgi:hypothetical protein